jgi:hypothetical protein
MESSHPGCHGLFNGGRHASGVFVGSVKSKGKSDRHHGLRFGGPDEQPKLPRSRKTDQGIMDKSTQKVSQGRTHEDILWKVLMRFDTRPGDGGGRQNITDLERRSEPWGEIKTIQVATRDYQDLSVHNLLIYKDISKT